MEIQKSDIVCSLAGRDKGQLYYVLEASGGNILLADGKGRRLDKLKRKNPKHLRLITVPEDRIAGKIKNGEKITDSEIRRSLQQMAAKEIADLNGEKGGM